MTIQFKCGQCGQTLKVGDNAAGKRAKCPKCQSVVSIPEVSDESSDLGPVPSGLKLALGCSLPWQDSGGGNMGSRSASGRSR